MPRGDTALQHRAVDMFIETELARITTDIAAAPAATLAAYKRIMRGLAAGEPVAALRADQLRVNTSIETWQRVRARLG